MDRINGYQHLVFGRRAVDAVLCAYVVLLREDFGWSKALMATAFAMSQLLNGLLAPVQGWMLDSLGSRLLVSCGLATFTAQVLTFLLLSTVSTAFGLRSGFACSG